MGHEVGDWDNSRAGSGFLGSLTRPSLLSHSHLHVRFGSWTISELVHLRGLNLPWKLGGKAQPHFLQGLLPSGLPAGPPCDNSAVRSDVHLGSWEGVSNEKRREVLWF